MLCRLRCRRADAHRQYMLVVRVGHRARLCTTTNQHLRMRRNQAVGWPPYPAERDGRGTQSEGSGWLVPFGGGGGRTWTNTHLCTSVGMRRCSYRLYFKAWPTAGGRHPLGLVRPFPLAARPDPETRLGRPQAGGLVATSPSFASFMSLWRCVCSEAPDGQPLVAGTLARSMMARAAVFNCRTSFCTSFAKWSNLRTTPS